ncbi:conserved hypothetical protein [Histoplasma capsulatum G186AR]|uniref:Uncharacterized protein n=2 Tax=Ajellomyces capsulatus TaxID=5037 RepID=C0NFI0_AJECG|nr:uncharacterized protein HCBG_01647 [Histoplasma capsulatum G186AR]EEH10001.1 conserved hypothetical protein [Histoplasma capsulatum G186AR]KAG5291055.1 hypothetical protein I7I52_08263 [Histoplasma capsulatum]QSS72983.1 hypothetical protein I7I50_00997 [Histoplasma capsulatum G186AR]
MRGIGFRSEALSSHFVCPSCCTRLTGDGYLRWYTVRPGHRARFVAQQSRKLSTGAYSPWSFKRLKTAWNASKLKDPEGSEPPFLLQALSFNLDTHRRTEADLKRQDGRPYKTFTTELMDTYYSMEDGILDYFDRENPDMVVYAFLGPEQIQSITYNLPDSAFAVALSLLTPSHFIEPHKKLHRRFHPAVAHAKGYKTLEVTFDEFKRVLHFAVEKRRGAGFKLGISEYTHLLDCARSMGDADMADCLWHDMRVDGIEPNTACYNHCMEAKAWHHAYVSKEKFNLRFTPWVYRKRSYSDKNVGYQGYSTAGENSVRQQVLRLFDEMVSSGQKPDEATYVNVMIASSREGHIVAVENVLKTVWNIDVELILTREDPANIPPVTQFNPTDPLHPTSRILYAVSHIFGSNNDLSTALRLVDFISTHYKIPIPDSVWLELIEWAYVLSVKRWGPRAEENSVGKVPKETVKRLFDTMTSSPYNVKPTLPLYDMLISTSWSRCNLDDTLKYMREGYALFQESLRRRNTAKYAFVDHLLNFLPEKIRTQVTLKNNYQRLITNLQKSGLGARMGNYTSAPLDPVARNEAIREAKRAQYQLDLANRLMPYWREEAKAKETGMAPSYLNRRWVRRQLSRLNAIEAEDPMDPDLANDTEEVDTPAVSLSMIKEYRAMKAAFNLEQLNTSRDASFIERWVRLLIVGRRWVPDTDRWERQLLPRFLREWEAFLPENVYYKTRGGIVEFLPISFWPHGKRERPEKGVTDRELGLYDSDEGVLLTDYFEIIGERPNARLDDSHDTEFYELDAARTY